MTIENTQVVTIQGPIYDETVSLYWSSFDLHDMLFLGAILQVRTVLDIGCGFGSFGAHLFSRQLLTMCIANYEASGSQVQLTLERGIPAMIGSFASKQLPYPYLSFDMLHCARCGIDWETKGMH